MVTYVLRAAPVMVVAGVLVGIAAGMAMTVKFRPDGGGPAQGGSSTCRCPLC